MTVANFVSDALLHMAHALLTNKGVHIYIYIYIYIYMLYCFLCFMQSCMHGFIVKVFNYNV